MKKEIGIIVGVLVLVLVGAFVLNKPTPSSAKYNAFAQCIKSSGAVFYGAFWCPHCKAQKALFGDAVQYLSYVECSTPDGQSQLPVCKEKGVQSYPTWVFANGDRLSGEVSMADLAEKTGCALPGDTTTGSVSSSTEQSVIPKGTASVIGGATSTSNGLPDGKL